MRTGSTPRHGRHVTLLVLWLALGLAAAVAAWWYGPAWAPLVFGLWCVPAAPLAFLTYRTTAIRWQRRVAAGLLVPALAALSIPGLFSWVPGPVEGMWFALPLPATAFVLLTTLFTGSLAARGLQAANPRSTRRAVLRIASAVGLGSLVAGSFWTWREHDWMFREAELGQAARFAGCYELRRTAWVPSDVAAHSIVGILPAYIRLDTMPGGPAGRSDEPPAAEDPFDGHFRRPEAGELLIRPSWWGGAYWQPLDERRARLVWTTGLHGVIVHAEQYGTGFRGVAEGFTDYGTPWPPPRARVHAISMDCLRLESLVRADSARPEA